MHGSRGKAYKTHIIQIGVLFKNILKHARILLLIQKMHICVLQAQINGEEMIAGFSTPVALLHNK